MDELRKELHCLLDQLPEEKLFKLDDYIVELFKEANIIPEVKPTKSEKEAIRQAKEEFKRGEHYTLEEVLSEIEGEEEMKEHN